jgi:hypothetical protein
MSQPAAGQRTPSSTHEPETVLVKTPSSVPAPSSDSRSAVDVRAKYPGPVTRRPSHTPSIAELPEGGVKRSDAKLPSGGLLFWKPRRMVSLAVWQGWLEVSVTNASADRDAS